jgi:hypothetical protein
LSDGAGALFSRGSGSGLRRPICGVIHVVSWCTMDRRGGHAAGSSSQGRGAWNTPLHSASQRDGGAVKMPVKKNAPLSFSSKPAVQNPVYSSSDEDSESGGEGGAQCRNVDALESSIMADYPSTEDVDDTGAALFA